MERKVIGKIEELMRAADIEAQEKSIRQKEREKQRDLELQEKHNLNNKILNSLPVLDIFRLLNRRYLNGNGRINISQSQVVADYYEAETDEGGEIRKFSRIIAWATLYWYEGRAPKIISLFVEDGKDIGIAHSESRLYELRWWLDVLMGKSGYSDWGVSPDNFAPTFHAEFKPGHRYTEDNCHQDFIKKNIDVNKLSSEDQLEKIANAIAKTFFKLYTAKSSPNQI